MWGRLSQWSGAELLLQWHTSVFEIVPQTSMSQIVHIGIYGPPWLCLRIYEQIHLRNAAYYSICLYINMLMISKYKCNAYNNKKKSYSQFPVFIFVEKYCFSPPIPFWFQVLLYWTQYRWRCQELSVENFE